ncbi:MAG: hypothetical protein A3I07_01385 [Candidatus Doudnabacteria bacterium RIFCSPLOWO2_02_FULL_42_9]|nr:MAG: hypothetical protein A3I07_01385 [Candidatus Doudnabacteria bacterium RIFCSPLOWO2_02_FULL_42_9]
MFESISGHKRQLELLEKALRNGKLAHAYVFAGPEGVGKKTVAKKLALELIEASSFSDLPKLSPDYFHPDLLEINGAEGIKIEQIRELAYKLSLKPYQAKHKVALIDHADQMTTEAANALLKVLEEPKSYAFLFLITSNPNKLPKTILSRCQKITFGPIERIPEVTDETLEADRLYKIFMSNSKVDRLISAYDMAGFETEEIKKIFDLWLNQLQQNLQTQASKALAKKVSQVMLARKFLDQNVNSKLLLTNLMLKT